MLAFFFDPSAPHNFGESIIQVFFDCLNIENWPGSLSLVSPPARELDANGGRIDLLLEGDDWVVVIENKIFHDVNNPFDRYMAYVNEKFSSKKHRYFVVISPEGLPPVGFQGWIGVSYSALIEKFRNAIGGIFLNQKPDKWLLFFRDFIINLEQVVEDRQDAPKEAIAFFLDNLSVLDRMVNEKNRAMQFLQGELYASLREKFSDKYLLYKMETWYGFPALRFYFDGMINKSTAVLFLDGRRGEGFGVYFYVCGIRSDAQRKDTDKAMEFFSDIGQPWDEQNKTIRGYCRYLPDTEIVTMEKMLAEVLERLDYFEREVRPHW